MANLENLCINDQRGDIPSGYTKERLLAILGLGETSVIMKDAEGVEGEYTVLARKEE